MSNLQILNSQGPAHQVWWATPPERLERSGRGGWCGAAGDSRPPPTCFSHFCRTDSSALGTRKSENDVAIRDDVSHIIRGGNAEGACQRKQETARNLQAMALLHQDDDQLLHFIFVRFARDLRLHLVGRIEDPVGHDGVVVHLPGVGVVRQKPGVRRELRHLPCAQVHHLETNVR